MPVLFKGQALSFVEGTYVTTRHRRVKQAGYLDKK